MKRFNIYLKITFLSFFLFSSCEELDLQPIDSTLLIEDEVYSTYDGYVGMLAKCYASFVLQGQGDGDVDISRDGGRSTFNRALFYLQECPTDEVLFHSSSGNGTWTLISMNWNPGTEVVGNMYYRLWISIAFCNEFLRKTEQNVMERYGVYNEAKDEVGYWRAEARFLRAYCYYLLCDLYGSVGWIDESSPNGAYPVQKTRTEIFKYVESELLDIEDDLMPADKKVFGRVNQVAAWFALSRLYLNGEVYTKESYYDEAYRYAKKVIEDPNYALAPNYIENFLKDNDTSPEIIWAQPHDDTNSQSHGGTNFLIKYSSHKFMINQGLELGITSDAPWNINGRLKTNLIDKFDIEDQTYDPLDTWCDKKKDKRALFYGGPLTGDQSKNPVVPHQKETWRENEPFEKNITLGYTFTKWRNVTKDRATGEDQREQYVSIAFPMFRKADAYLMAAEAILRGGSGSRAEALSFVNEVRHRAYNSGNYISDRNVADGSITDSQLDLDFILDERARELWTESIRRTDLIRFNKFTKGYNWDWKGQDTSGNTNHEGKDVDDKYNLYPIPQDEILYNPNLTQNPNYL
ncbi:Starch-binding associating with outer membrane [Zobellia uliginosa]|uniref:Starch-binding associating with outer membrane n=1 Tax=Zobellia uliginosa TaxID=143224 RepID=A0ABY1KKS0_9FLAO|nr:RagB/SusD family nutrient uptake outer membrane protein [Zobellia uliginosa]SIS46436.1 Starch-binding associating with outer membrane [Zobellia uliginosa]